MKYVESVAQIWDELLRQEVKWKRAPGDWVDHPWLKNLVLGEEVGEVARGILEHDDDNVREELVQVAAVCINWLMSDF